MSMFKHDFLCLQCFSFAGGAIGISTEQHCVISYNILASSYVALVKNS